ncbi:MAG TPA: GIY-YIG nuclease family protein [Acidimicrobiales bacterium]|nr:GIY-YIG nuclease family protein [Acidimicrobiales bacterium]
MLENAWSYIHWLEDALAAFMAEERAERARLAVETIGESFDPRGYFVYLLFGEDDARPIYVGQSSNVLSRLGNHMSANDRRGRVTRVGLIRCADDRQMFALERELIEHYRPELNVRLVPVEDQSAASRAPWMPHDLDGKIALGASVPRVF